MFSLLIDKLPFFTAIVDAAMFGRNINLPSYIYSLLFTIAFSLIVNGVMYFKLKRINMVESLKSRVDLNLNTWLIAVRELILSHYVKLLQFCDRVTSVRYEGTKAEVGSTMTLYLNDDSLEFANEYRVREVIEKYCFHLPP